MDQRFAAESTFKHFSIRALLQKWHEKTREIIAALFIFLFSYTALSKLLDYNSFEYVLSKSPFIDELAGFLAIALPAIELLVSLLLLVPITRKMGMYSSLLLMIAFTLYLGYMVAFEPNKPCSCGGVISKMTWEQHLVFNIFFTFLALVGVVLESKFRRKG